MKELAQRILELKRIRMLLALSETGTASAIQLVSEWIDEHQRELDEMAAKQAA